MTFKVNQDIKMLVISIFQNNTFDKPNQVRKRFIINVLWCFLSINSKVYFLQLERFSSNCE